MEKDAIAVTLLVIRFNECTASCLDFHQDLLHITPYSVLGTIRVHSPMQALLRVLVDDRLRLLLEGAEALPDAL